MQTEARQLNSWSWMFIAAGTMRALLIPAAGAVVASGGFLLTHLHFLSLLLIVPALVYAFIRQKVYSYRFTDSELVVRDGLLTKNVRHISYERIHNVALVRNPIHRLLGVTTARIETAAGGKPEALLRVLSLEAADELRRYSLGEEQAIATDSPEARAADAPLLQVPDLELVRLGLISNRGFIVVAAGMGVFSQTNWWDQDWMRAYAGVHAKAPEWAAWLFDSGSLAGRALLGLAFIVFFLVLLRLLSIAWYLVRYRGFTLRQKNEELRAEYGLLTLVSSLIPVHRIQLVTITSTLLHRCFGRTSIDVETAGASTADSDLSGQLAASGVNTTRQWLAPIIETGQATGLVHHILPEIDIEAVGWKPIEARATRRIVKRVALAVMPITVALAAVLTFSLIPLSGWHALWLPLVVLTMAWLIARQWVRHAGYALTEHAIYFRSGWLSRQISVVRFVNMQTVSIRQTPFDHRKRMATVAVDTAGAGATGHRIRIPFLDVDVALSILQRLYAETRSTEFRW
ncbi:MAG: PH domain-containing protein [Thermoanaerobaculales bacterium]|nr:PH domain-containing protein [Thermoanaerobaculales bacterium]